MPQHPWIWKARWSATCDLRSISDRCAIFLARFGRSFGVWPYGDLCLALARPLVTCGWATSEPPLRILISMRLSPNSVPSRAFAFCAGTRARSSTSKTNAMHSSPWYALGCVCFLVRSSYRFDVLFHVSSSYHSLTFCRCASFDCRSR